MRSDRLEADRQQVLRREDAPGLLPAGIPEGLDRLEVPPDQILGHRLDQRPADPLPLVAGQHPRGHQLHRVRRDRTGGEGQRAGHIGGRRVEHKAHRSVVHIGDPPAGAPLQQHRRDPGLLLQLRLPRLDRGLPTHLVQLPEHAGSTRDRKVGKTVQRKRYEPASHAPTPLGSAVGMTRRSGNQSSPNDKRGSTPPAPQAEGPAVSRETTGPSD